MTVICVEAVDDTLRGTLSRWMIEPIAGTFVGPLPASVREEVWTMVRRHASPGRAILVHSDDSDQGFAVRTAGESRRRLIDLDGLVLIAMT